MERGKEPTGTRLPPLPSQIQIQTQTRVLFSIRAIPLDSSRKGGRERARLRSSHPKPAARASQIPNPSQLPAGRQLRCPMASSSCLPRGCRFSPSDADLISAYLRPMIAREPLPEPAARFLHTADVYAADPAALVSGFLPAVLLAPKTGVERRYWYFFGSAKALSGHDKRRSRAVGGDKGKWHSEKGREAVLNGEGRGVVGYKQNFSYKPSNADGSEAAVWLMVEFGVKDLGDDETGEPVPVLCKVYQSPRKPRSASISTSPAHKRERKRKARDELPASSPVTTVKRRLLVPPAAPILPPAVQPQPDLNNYSDGVSLDQLLDDLLMSGLTPDQVLGDFLMPLPESDVNCSFSMANQAGSAASSYCDEGGAGARTPFSDNSDQILLGELLMPVVPASEVNYSFSMSDHAGSAVSSYCDEGGAGARTPFSDNFGQVLLGDLLMPVPESEVNYSFSMSDHAGSVASNYDKVLHGGSVTPLFDNSDQFDLSMLNFSFLPSAPYAGICDSWTGGDTTDDEAASVSWYDSAPSSPAIPTEWMMQSPFATPYLF